MSKNQPPNIPGKLRRFFHPITIYNNLKSIFFTIIPKGSKRYELTYDVMRTFIKQFQPFNIYYREWIRLFDKFDEEDLQKVKHEIQDMQIKPQFSIIMPVYNPSLKFLEEAIQSAQEQIYPHWELCIADDASTDPRVRPLIESFTQADNRIKVIFRPKNGHISAASNSALSLAQFEYSVLLDHDDKLHPLALYHAAKVIEQHPDSEIIFSDEDKITKRGKRLDPYFKPEFDYELLLSQNMVSHLGIYRTATIRKVGGFRLGLEGSQDYDLLLRVLERCEPLQIQHIPRPLYHWRISKQSVAENIDIKPYAANAGQRAISEHLERRSVPAEVTFLSGLAGYSVAYTLPDPLPSVNLILIGEQLDKTLQRCLELILQNTTYANYKITVALQTIPSSTEHLLPEKWSDKIDFFSIRQTSSQSHAVIINDVISQTTSDLVCLLDQSLSGFTPGWLSDLVGQALQKGIGAVAPRLLNQNDTVFSNGMILISGKLPQHLSKGDKKDESGYFGWPRLCRGYSALSEKCLLFKRSDFDDAEGFNQQLHETNLIGVDFCLRLKQLGLRNVLRPSVMLYLDDRSDENEINASELAFLEQQWHQWFEADPSFNPNLTINDDSKITVNLAPTIDFPG